MIVEALKWLSRVTDPVVITVGDHQYYADQNKELNIIEPPTFDSVSVRTLLGLTQLIDANLENLGRGANSTSGPGDPTAGDVMVLIVDHLNVSLVSRASDKWGRRLQYATARCDNVSQFAFGNFQSPEQFVIGLQSNFVPGSGDIDYLLKLASNLKAENVALAEDDGISQRATVRTGVVVAATETIRSRVKLAPYRTFREVTQPPSEFLFRLRAKEGEPPLCALFEADGGQWKTDAMSNIGAWLSRNTKDIPVIT